MTDREKVIFGLKCLTNEDPYMSRISCHKKKCPYAETETDNCAPAIWRDALALLKAQGQEISRLKHHVDCDAAEKLPSGCVGYGRGFNDDEPCETCKACKKYNGYEEGELE